jgi:hypothetical protein
MPILREQRAAGRTTRQEIQMFKFRRTAPEAAPVESLPAAVPSSYVVLDGTDSVVESGVTHVAALRLIDWMTVHDTTAGPFRCMPLTDAR